MRAGLRELDRGRDTKGAEGEGRAVATEGVRRAVSRAPEPKRWAIAPAKSSLAFSCGRSLCRMGCDGSATALKKSMAMDARTN